MRVVSLLPSATEMVHFAGAGDALGGVTHECDYPRGVERLRLVEGVEVLAHLLHPEVFLGVRAEGQ